ncbi:MAG: TRAP transporter substrate-binding protein DctP [Limisphaerales bacterium]
MKSLTSLSWSSILTASWMALMPLLPTGQAAERIKLATLAPTGSSYHQSLLALRDAWRKASNGKVELVVYADGKLGGEAETVGLMGVNSLQASLLTAIGLAEIEVAVSGLQNIPMGFRSLAEVDYVGEKLQPMLEERLAAKGYQVLFWSDAGWVRFFSRKPVVHPDDLRKQKLFTWSGSPEAIQIYKAAGFDAVPLETADIVPSLQTGLIDAVPVPPIYALTAQIDSRAPHMVDINWGPLVGACVIRKATWDKFPAALREEMLRAAVITGQQIKEKGRQEMVDSIKAMEKRGLKVSQTTPEVEAEWRAAAEAVYPMVRGKIVPADIFDEALSLLQEFRSRPASQP